jgi:diguanylate cyclase
MTLVSLDVDHFKSINDSLGHEAGDAVLSRLGELLRRRARSVDKVFRLGGEEFLVFLFGTDLENGKSVAEELRGIVESHDFLPDRKITASFGVATLRPAENWTEWIKRGDKNLYRAKEEGRNRVVA